MTLPTIAMLSTRIGLERLLAAVDLGRQQGIRLPRFLLEGDGQLLCAERLDGAERQRRAAD